MRDRSVRDGVPRLAAYGVHLLTASGAVCGLLALQGIAGGRFKTALVWMAVAVVIDGVDGPLARSVGVSRVLPGIDGTLLDNVVDYLNYVVVPAFLIVEASLVPLRLEVVGGAAICLSSAFQFTRIDAKTPDHFFRGFPSYWNVLAFYLLVLRPDPRLNLAIIAVWLRGRRSVDRGRCRVGAYCHRTIVTV